MKTIAKADSEHFQIRADKYAACLAVAAERGVRVISDYFPPQVCRREDYKRIFALERKLGSRPEFAEVARYIQLIARYSCVSSGEETGP